MGDRRGRSFFVNFSGKLTKRDRPRLSPKRTVPICHIILLRSFRSCCRRIRLLNRRKMSLPKKFHRMNRRSCCPRTSLRMMIRRPADNRLYQIRCPKTSRRKMNRRSCRPRTSCRLMMSCRLKNRMNRLTTSCLFRMFLRMMILYCRTMFRLMTFRCQERSCL